EEPRGGEHHLAVARRQVGREEELRRVAAGHAAPRQERPIGRFLEQSVPKKYVAAGRRVSYPYSRPRLLALFLVARMADSVGGGLRGRQSSLFGGVHFVSARAGRAPWPPVETGARGSLRLAAKSP